MGLDLLSALSINALIAGGKSADLLRLWECSILQDSVMVYGSNPTLACTASLAIASLTYPEEPPDNVMPFVAVTDPRFQTITQSHAKGLIVGFSNPIALNRVTSFDVVFRTGFDANKDGIGTVVKGTWKALAELEKLTNSEIRHMFYLNNCKVAEAVSGCLDELMGVNPYAAFVGQVDSAILGKHLVKQGIPMTLAPKVFAAKLLRSKLFLRVWQVKKSLAILAQALKVFSADEFCTGMSEHELIDFYSMVRNVRKTSAGDPELEKAIDADIRTITLYLSPDLILAPE
jgi:hypothetical protein